MLSDTALAALELREQPFAEGPADGDTFTDDVTAEQLADIRQALITGDDLLLILGERGAGKSTLLNQLAGNSGLRIQCFSVKGGPRFSTRNLFTGMLEAFKIEPPEDLKATLDELIPCLQAMVGGNKLCVIVLDDAEALAEHELTTLLSGMLYVNSRDESLLRIALSAEPAFEERIPDLLPQGADLPYSSLSLEPFDDARAAAYLGFRLERAGRFDALPFDEDEIAALNARAGGRPGALHAAAAAALENAHGVPGTGAATVGAGAGAPIDAPPPDADLPPELRSARRPPSGGAGLGGRGIKLALGALAGALIVGGLLLFRPAPEPGANEERYRVVEQRKVETARETERLRLLEEKEAGATDRDAAPPADAAPTVADAAGASGTGAAGADDTRDADADAGPATASGVGPGALDDVDTDAAGTDDADADADGATDGTRAGTDAAPAGAGGDERPSSSTDGGADPAAPLAPEPAPEPSTGTAPAPSPAADTDEASEPEPEPEPTVAEPPAESGSAAPRGPADEPEPSAADADGVREAPPSPDDDEAAPSPVAPPPEEPVIGALESPNWVLVQNPSQYTVQMSASTDRASVVEFLEQAELPEPNSIFSFDRSGRTWYALVHGLYPSIAEARAAIERMSSAAQSNQPWIRAVGRIQETLREQN